MKYITTSTIAWTQIFFNPNFATCEVLDLQKWPTPQIKGPITAISEMPQKIVLITLKYLKQRKHVSFMK